MRDTPLDPRLHKAASQVQIRLVGQGREEVEAALARLQMTAGIQVQRGPCQGRKGEWLVYASLALPASLAEDGSAKPSSGPGWGGTASIEGR